MRQILISPPAIEPVSLAETKLWLRDSSASEDQLIAALITGARQTVEKLTRTVLITQGWRLVADEWPPGRVVDIPVAPLRVLDAIRLYDALNSAQTLDANGWSVHTGVLSSRILFAQTPPQPGRAIAGIEIDVTAGYGDAPGDVPQPLRQAILLLVARAYENRGDAGAGEGAEVEHLIAPFRKMRLA